MITACKSYITNRGSETIWTQDSPVVREKLNDCIQLNVEYQSSFQKTKNKLEDMQNERKFEFPEMLIFGKFEKFVKRLRKILEMFDIIAIYSRLQESKIEGNSVKEIFYLELNAFL